MTDTFNVREALRDVYDNARIEDDARANTDEHECRDVIVELPAALPHKPADDELVKLPIRVAWNAGSGIVLEVGPYDVNDVSVQMLKQAIAWFEHCGGETFPMEKVVKGSPSAAIYPEDDAERHQRRRLPHRSAVDPVGRSAPQEDHRGVTRMDDEERQGL
jgi:hypothetical protein